jgi:hypothetical protein
MYHVPSTSRLPGQTWLFRPSYPLIGCINGLITLLMIWQWWRMDYWPGWGLAALAWGVLALADSIPSRSGRLAGWLRILALLMIVNLIVGVVFFLPDDQRYVQ